MLPIAAKAKAEKAKQDHLREDIDEKKVSFEHCPNQPPRPPNAGNSVPFFGRQKRRFARMIDFFLDDDNEGCNDNYDDNYGNFDDNYDKNDKKNIQSQ